MGVKLFGTMWISTHALREEGDVYNSHPWSFWVYFYPRPPRGGRHLQSAFMRCTSGFLPTPSARRATDWRRLFLLLNFDFYPRPPRGGRQYRRKVLVNGVDISTHALREEGDYRG